MNNSQNRYMRICSTETIYSHKKGFFNGFCESTKESIGLAYIFNILKNVKEDKDIIRKVYINENINIKITTISNKFLINYKKKNSTNSKIKRINSLRLTTKHACINSLDEINQAILQAPEIGECVAVDNGYTLLLALLTRGQILVKLNEYIYAYKDLRISTKLNIPFLNVSKIVQNILLCRFLKKIIVFSEFKLKSCQQWKDEFLNLNQIYFFISNAIKIKNSFKFGKESVANSVINPGEILVIENPIASCLFPKFFNSHCQTCLKRCKIIYGCPNCSAIGFCSYTCRNIGIKSFHKYECKLSSIFIGSGMSLLSHLALRIVTQLGLQKCLKIYGHLYEGKPYMDLKDYLRLYNLEKHPSQRLTIDYFERSLMTIFLIQCLKQADFFGTKICVTSSSENEIKIGTLLLLHLQLLQFNTYEIYETNLQHISNMFYNNNKTAIGIGIYSCAARFNHECYSSTFRYFNGNIIILKSSRLLTKNEVIGENYGPVFTKNTLIERIQYLSGRYWFKCCCRACTNHWPLLNEINRKQLRIRCSSKSCTGEIVILFDKNYDKLYDCKKCRISFKISKLHQNIIKRCIIWYAYGSTIVAEECICEAIKILLIALKTFHYVATAPNRFTHLAESYLQYCLRIRDN